MQSWTRTNPNHLAFPQLAHSLYQLAHCAPHEQAILHSLAHRGLASEVNLHWLYAIVKGREGDECAELLSRLQVHLLIADWIHQDHVTAVGLGNYMSLRSLEEMIELLDLEMEERAGQAAEEQYLLLVQEMLACVYELIDRSHSVPLRSRFLNCIGRIYQLMPELVNVGIYAEMLSTMEAKQGEFFSFFGEYLEVNAHRQDAVVRCLLDGLALRLRHYADKPHLTLLEKNSVTNCYFSLTKFLQWQRKSEWPLVLLKEHAPLVDYLLLFTTRNLNHLKVAQIINGLIEVYAHSQMGNLLKFELILRIYKHIVLKASSLFTFVLTNYLAEQPDFLYWFVETELRMDRAKDIVETYLANQFSVEFLLVVVIYYIHQFPGRVAEVAALMRVINLMEEVRPFLDSEVVKQYLKIFHTHIHEQEYYEAFINSVEDRQLDRC